MLLVARFFFVLKRTTHHVVGCGMAPIHSGVERCVPDVVAHHEILIENMPFAPKERQAARVGDQVVVGVVCGGGGGGWS